MQQKKQSVGILGATGMVGQRFIQLLEHHPWFEITWLAASDRSSGKRYGEAVNWKLDTPLPREHRADAGLSRHARRARRRIIFAALDSDIARELEPRFAASGCAVISNSSAFRMAPGCPARHSRSQPRAARAHRPAAWRRESGGYIVTNPNCCAVGLVMALKPLGRRFRPRVDLRHHHAGHQRRRLSWRGIAGYSRQRRPLH